MKSLNKFLTALLGLSLLTPLQSREIDHSLDQLHEILEIKMTKRKKEFIQKLFKAKYWMINGDISKSLDILLKLTTMNKELDQISNRYLGTAYFILNEHEISHKYFDTKYFNNNPSTKKYVCLMQIVNKIAIQDKNGFSKYVASCKSHLKAHSDSESYWPTLMAKMNKPDKSVSNYNFLKISSEELNDKDLLRIWLKANLYFNSEKFALKYIGTLPELVFKYKELRELIALMYYRTEEFDKSLSFIENIDTSNAENIRGSIYLKNKKFELAYAHFKMAAAYKSNSTNALERLIPLSWNLAQWNEALKLVNQYKTKNLDLRKKYAFKAALLMKLEKFEEAKKTLEFIPQKTTKTLPYVINMLYAYILNKTGHTKRAQYYSGINCQEYNGLSCWYKMQSTIWPKMSKTIKSKIKIAPYAHNEILALFEEKKITPLKEERIINQEEIEQLDFGYYNN